MYNMYSLSIRKNRYGKKFVYLVKRKKKSGKFEGVYLGPMNHETLSATIEIISRMMLHISEREIPGSRVRCPICGTPVSSLGIEDLVAGRFYQRVKEMERNNEDIYNTDEYETLKLIADTLTK